MRGLPVWIGTLLLSACLLGSTPCHAQLTPAQRKELGEVSDQLSQISGLIRDKDFLSARGKLADAEGKLTAITSQAPASDPLVTRLTNLVSRHRAAIDKALAPGEKGAAPPAADARPSFVDHVAPIISGKCVSCHGATNPGNGLQLDTFAGWRKGGRGGAVLAPANAGRSLLLARLTTSDQNARMPRNGEALSADEIAAITKWINAGAKFDGGSEAASLPSLMEQREEAKLNITIPKPKGTEQVKFTRDIAPWFNNLCLNCHNSNRKSGGLSVETFYDLMKGGESGPVIIPGDMETSRLFRLVGGLELPRMPASDARITRKNYDDLRTWFREGNTFDGDNPRASIRTLARAQEENQPDRFSSMSDQQFRDFRKERSQDQLKRAVPSDVRELVEAGPVLLLGNVPRGRLEELSRQAQQRVDDLRQRFDGPEQPWRGGLAVFVLKDRFSFDEFNETVLSRRADTARGLVRLTASHEDALIVLLDQPPTGGGLDVPAELTRQLASAWLQRSGGTIPLWLREGTGLYLAESVGGQSGSFAELEKTARQLAPTVEKPEELFSDRAFSPESNAAVGFAIVKFLHQGGRGKQFGQLVAALQSGRNLDEALQSSYRMTTAQLATSFLASLKR